MRKIRNIILLVVALSSVGMVYGQHYIGVRGGYGGGLGRFYPATYLERQNQKMTLGLWSGGIAWKYYTPEKYLGGVSAEVEFLQRGFEYHLEYRDSDTTYRRTINTINVPFIWQPHINIANNRMRVFLNAGVYVSYNINSRQQTLIAGEGVIQSSPYEMNLVRDNPFGFGLQGGLGFNVIFGKWELQAEARYYFSYGDILRNRNKYPGSQDPAGNWIEYPNPLRSPVDAFNVTLGLWYRIGDKPHAPPPGPRAIRRQQERLAEKEQKQARKEAEKSEKEASRAARKERKADGGGEGAGESSANTPTEDVDAAATDGILHTDTIQEDECAASVGQDQEAEVLP